MKKTNTTLGGVVLAVVLLIIACGIGFGIGFVMADGSPEVINLTDTQENNIIKQQERICERETAQLTKDKERMYELVKENYTYYEDFTRALENVNITPEFNFTIQVHDKNVMDYNLFDMNILSC